MMHVKVDFHLYSITNWMKLFQTLHIRISPYCGHGLRDFKDFQRHICPRKIANDVCKRRSSAVFNKRPSIVNINNHIPTSNDAWDFGRVSYLLRGALILFMIVDFDRSSFKEKKLVLSSWILQHGYADWDGLAISLEITRPSAGDQASTWVGELFLTKKKRRKKPKAVQYLTLA